LLESNDKQENFIQVLYLPRYMNEPGRHYETNLSKITFPFTNCQSNPIVAYMRLGVAAKNSKAQKIN